MTRHGLAYKLDVLSHHIENGVVAMDFYSGFAANSELTKELFASAAHAGKQRESIGGRYEKVSLHHLYMPLRSKDLLP